MENRSWYSIADVDEIDSPALLVYPERVKHNIDTAIRMVGDVGRLRPHIKTSKSADVSKLLIAAGVTKFKCATIAEAEMLARCGAKDVLLAYQPLGPKLRRFADLILRYPDTRFSCLVDHPSVVPEMEHRFTLAGLHVGVYIDVNLGQNRTGIRPGRELVELYSLCAVQQSIRPLGLHAYDGHIRDQDWNTRKIHCDAAFELVEQMKKQILQRGLPEPVIIAGGSPTFSIHCKRPGIECSPGTFVYWDKGYLDLCPEQDFLPAALVLSRVVSFPDDGKICIDLGHKSIAAENDILRRVFFLNAPELKPVSQSEEHLVLEAGAGHGYTLGQVLYGLPYHICPTVNLYDSAVTIIGGRIADYWLTTARTRRISV